MKTFTNLTGTVEAVQYIKGMTFDDRYKMLKWTQGKFGLSIYADCIVVSNGTKRAKMCFGDWITRGEDGTVGLWPRDVFEKEFQVPGYQKNWRPHEPQKCTE